MSCLLFLMNVPKHLDNYGDGMKNTYGPEVQWVRGPFDAQVMYNNTGRKPHGKFAIADGAIDSSTIQSSTTAHPSQPQSAQSSTERYSYNKRFKS